MSSTEQLHKEMVTALVKPAQSIVAHLNENPDQAHLWHMATGVSGEAGELLDAIKKHVVYGREPDVQNIVEELGDLEFYLEGIRQHFDITRELTLQANYTKLYGSKSARYSSGSYSDEQANTRSDKLIEEHIANGNTPIEMVPGTLHIFSSTKLSEYAYYLGKNNAPHVSASVRNEHLYDFLRNSK